MMNGMRCGTTIVVIWNLYQVIVCVELDGEEVLTCYKVRYLHDINQLVLCVHKRVGN